MRGVSKGDAKRGFRGIQSFLSLCYKKDKIYILHLLLLQIYTSITGIMIVVMPRYIIDATFTYHNLYEALMFTVVFSTSLLLINVLVARSNKKILEHRMKVFKEFQLDISEMMMNADFGDVENEEYLNTKAKAEKFLYGDGRGFAYVLESGFAIISQIITLIVMAGTIVLLNPLIMLLLIAVLIVNAKINATTQIKNIAIGKEKTIHERRSAYFSNVTQDYRYGKDIRCFAANTWILRCYEQQLDKMQNFYERMARNNAFYETIISLTSYIQQIMSYLYVIYCGIKQIISMGQFSMYLSAITSFSSTLKAITANIIALRQYTRYYEDYEKYMGYSKNTDLTIPTATFNGSISFEHVSFKYPGQTRYALRDINLKICPGDKILVVGENGAGKSTLIKLLLRLYVPTEGRILIDGVDINRISRESYYKLFATVFQDYKLFACPIVENVSMNNIYDVDRVNMILSDLNLDEKINALSSGINTNIYKEFDQNGYTPSGGEAQKIAIARAAYKNAPFVIMDEPTAALDPRAEEELYVKLDKMFHGKTTLYISHRLSAACMCKTIIALKNGRIVENGTHKRLMELDGVYAGLFKTQSKRYAFDAI